MHGCISTHSLSLIQDKFKDSPIKIDEVLDKLVGLSSPGVTASEVKEAILPLINAHQDLVMEMRHFLYQLAPAPRCRFEQEFQEVCDPVLPIP